MNQAYLSTVEYYLPEAVLDNAGIHRQHPEWSVDKIAAKTGIAERHLAAPDEYTSDLCVEAAVRLFERHAIDKQVIDYLVVCTQSPDYLLPTTACIVQDRLGLRMDIGALDINMGSSGFVYGLGLAKGLIATGQSKNLLFITAETYSKFVHPDDKNNKTLFGDAAAAALITAGPHGGLIREFCYGTDGSGHQHLIVRNGGMRGLKSKGTDVLDAETGAFLRNDDNLFMDGKAIFEFTAFKVPSLVRDTLDKNGLTVGDVDLFVFHQANEYMLNTVRKRCGIPEEKFFVFMKDSGNTVSSTIPIALRGALDGGRIRSGKTVLLAGFGVGLSMGATVISY